MDSIRLSDAIENLRAELHLAREMGKNQSLQFNIETIEVELEVIAERSGDASGKINWCIFGAGVATKANNASKHKLTMTLQAVDGSGQAIRVSQQHDVRPD